MYTDRIGCSLSLFVQLLPDENTLQPLKDILVAAAVLKSVSVLCLCISQVQGSTAFIDWEKPKKIVTANTTADALAPTSCWRSILIMNEWAELQAERYVSPFVTSIIVLISLEGFKWVNSVKTSPVAGNIMPWDVTSFLLRVGLDTSVFAAAYLGQVIIRVVLLDRISGHVPTEFVDLCFTGQLKIFLMYIHIHHIVRFIQQSFFFILSFLLSKE